MSEPTIDAATFDALKDLPGDEFVDELVGFFSRRGARHDRGSPRIADDRRRVRLPSRRALADDLATEVIGAVVFPGKTIARSSAR